MTKYAIFQLADEKGTYGPDAGKFIVTSADHEQEYSGPMSQRDAEAYVAMLEALEQFMLVDWSKPANAVQFNLMMAENARAAIAEATRRAI